MTYRICTIEGDGIGHEVIPAALDVLAATGITFEVVPAQAGWDCFQATGSALPEETLELVEACDATLFGAISSPPYKVEGYFSPIRGMRMHFDLYANIRPTLSWPIETSRQGIDLLIVRENSEGLYVGLEESDGETAIAKRVITRKGSTRIVELACEQAMRRRRQLTLVHKANVLNETCGLFRKVGYEVASRYPELEVNDLFVDAMAMRLIKDPQSFDVIVTTNLFGDICRRGGNARRGLGWRHPATSANGAVFEPVHGQPGHRGRGIAIQSPQFFPPR